MAEKIMLGLLRKAGRKDIEATSAGLVDTGGAAGDPIAAGLLEQKGFSADHHKSRLLTPEIARDSDMIIVMEQAHREVLAGDYPDLAERIHLLKSFSFAFGPHDRDIKDCYRKSIYHYRLCFSEIFLSIEGMLKCI